jgi:hypothetical protein
MNNAHDSYQLSVAPDRFLHTGLRGEEAMGHHRNLPAGEESVTLLYALISLYTIS